MSASFNGLRGLPQIASRRRRESLWELPYRRDAPEADRPVGIPNSEKAPVGAKREAARLDLNRVSELAATSNVPKPDRPIVERRRDDLTIPAEADAVDDVAASEWTRKLAVGSNAKESDRPTVITKGQATADGAECDSLGRSSISREAERGPGPGRSDPQSGVLVRAPLLDVRSTRRAFC